MANEEPIDAGARVAAEAAASATLRAEDYCSQESARIALANEPRVNVLQAEGRHLTEQNELLERRLRALPPPMGDPDTRTRRRRYYYAIGGILTLAAFAFTVIGLAPYRLGSIGILYSLGIAVATPFVVDEFLDLWQSAGVLKVVAAGVFAAAIIGGILLAAVRGEVLTRKAEPADASVVFDTGAPETPAKGSFAEATETPLELLMLCFALAIDLGAGIALHRARAMGADPDGRAAVERELAAVRERLSAAIAELTALRNAPREFAARFWRDFHRSLLSDAARRAILKGMVLTVLAAALSSYLRAAERLDVVVGLDLSTSEGAPGEDHKSPFERNVEAVARLLASVPAGTRVTVIGITRDSIADPAPLFAAQLSADSGYFDERLASGRANLVRAWRARASHLAPTASGTDIIGALFLAGDIFHKGMVQSRKVLLLYSDMRHSTAVLNMEAPNWGPAANALTAVEAQHQIADLAGVTVYVGGANGGGRQVGEWQEVKTFWLAYFGKAGARCEGYSILATPVRLE